MKSKTWNQLYDIRASLIKLYLSDDNPKTQEEIDKVIKIMTEVIDNNK